MKRVDRAIRLAEMLQDQVVRSLRANLVAGRSGSGEPFASYWHDRAVFPNGLRSDRAGGMGLVDTGEMLRSIRPGRIERRGNRLVCFIDGAGYAKRQHRGFVQPPPVVIPRTQAERVRVRSGSYRGLNRGDTVFLRGAAVVPPRPFISVDPVSIESTIASWSAGG